jgi:23S rRNA pseudouridine1911/1915/1917 synthase
MNILFEDNHLIVVVKEPNIPMQEDESKDLDLLNMIKDYLRVKYNKPGNIYVGLVHRLDRPVGGVVVFAKTSKAASRLSEAIRTRMIDKEYLAIVEGKLSSEGTLTDTLKKDTRLNTTKVVEDDDPEGKLAQLEYRVISTKENLSLVKIKLLSGRSHQIRVQFASRNHPIWGDARYNPGSKPGQQIALWAVSLSFPHPVTKEKMTFTSEPPNTHPWNRFL